MGRRLCTFALVCAVGVCSWLAINGVWCELSALVLALPEGWALPAYISMTIEVANVCPLLYALVVLLAASKNMREKVDAISVGAIIGVNALACAVLALCWYKHPLLPSHSGMLIFSIFVSGMASTLSTITMFTFARGFPDARHAVAMQAGMALSGTIPACIALVQAPGQAYQRFSVEAYFWCLCGVLLAGWVCFGAAIVVRFRGASNSYQSGMLLPDDNGGLREAESGESQKFAWVDSAALFVLNFVENGALPQIVTYATLPFGSLALEMCNVLAMIFAPLACFAALIFQWRASGFIHCLAALVPFSYVLAAALMSPTPALCGSHNTAGGALVVSFYVADKILISYSKSALWLRIYKRSPSCEGKKGESPLVRASSCCQQGGSFAGALIFFCLVNFASVFDGASEKSLVSSG